MNNVMPLECYDPVKGAYDQSFVLNTNSKSQILSNIRMDSIVTRLSKYISKDRILVRTVHNVERTNPESHLKVIDIDELSFKITQMNTNIPLYAIEITIPFTDIPKYIHSSAGMYDLINIILYYVNICDYSILNIPSEEYLNTRALFNGNDFDKYIVNIINSDLVVSENYKAYRHYSYHTQHVSITGLKFKKSSVGSDLGHCRITYDKNYGGFHISVISEDHLIGIDTINHLSQLSTSIKSLVNKIKNY